MKGRSLSPEEGDPAPEVEQTGKGGRHVGECGCGEDAASPLLVFRREVTALPEYGKGTLEAGVPLDRECDEVDQRGDSHRRQSGHHNDDTCDRGSCECRRDWNAHHDDHSDLFRSLRDPHEPGALCERLVAHAVLHGMPDLVSCHGNGRERFATENIGRQADGFGYRIVVVAQLGRFDCDVLHVESIEQMPGQLSARSRVVRAGRTMPGKHPPGPELRTQYDNRDQEQQQDETHHLSRFPSRSCRTGHSAKAGGQQVDGIDLFPSQATTMDRWEEQTGPFAMSHRPSRICGPSSQADDGEEQC